MTKVTLRGPGKVSEISVGEDCSEIILFSFISWINENRRYSNVDGNIYDFPKDSFIQQCNIKAKKLGLITHTR